ILVVAVLLVVALAASGIATFGQRTPAHGPHAFLEQLPDGTPYRWDPCQAIHFVVNPVDEPPGAGSVVREAIRRVSDATGIGFVAAGPRPETADQQIGTSFQSNLPNEPRWLPLLIAFVPRDHFDFLADTRRALAFGEPHRGEGDEAHTFVSGLV